MTEHKTMNTIVHAAFRRDLQRFDVALGRSDASTMARATELGAAWDNYAAELHHHHTYEEEIFWPALESLGVTKELTGELESEHVRMVAALGAADEAMQSYRSAPSRAAAARAAIAELSDVLHSHLAHEERDLEPLSAEYHTTPQMKAAVNAVKRAHRGRMGNFFAWLLDGADADAVRGLRREVPPPVLFVLCRIPGRHYRRSIAPVWA